MVLERDACPCPIIPMDIEVPQKLSELILLAVADVELIEKRLDARICMDDWVQFGMDKNVCLVCLAGAMMVTHGDDSFEATPTDFSPEWQAAFLALDLVRSGCITAAYMLLMRDRVKVYPLTYVTIKAMAYQDGKVRSYEDNPIEFLEDLRKVSAALWEIGL